MKNSITHIIIYIVAIIGTAILIDRCSKAPNKMDRYETITIQRDTTIIHDTITIEKPVPQHTQRTRQVRARLEIATTATTETDRTCKDSAQHNQQNAYKDSASVIVPIYTNTYTDSATYKAVISGYNISLDKIEVYQKTKVIKECITKSSKNRWGLGVQVGAGATKSGIQPYIGIGINYNIFTW